MLIEILFAAHAVLAAAPRGTVGEDRAEAIAAAEQAAIETEELPFKGERAAEKTALLLDAVILVESGFRKSVEDCRERGDHGLAVGLTQLYRGRNWAGHDEAELCGDVGLQVQLALRVLTRSRKACGGDEGRWLAGYNSGRCAATNASVAAQAEYRRLLARFEPTWGGES